MPTIRRISWRCVALAALLAPTTALAELQIAMELGVGRMDRPTVSAEVIDDEGRPATRRTVEFYLLPEFFPNAERRLHGSHPVFVGSGTTDTTGRASTAYDPPFTGPAAFEARILGADGRPEGSARLDASIARDGSPVPTSLVQGLDAVRRPLGFAMVGLVAGLWLFLITLAVVTVRRIRRAGEAPPSSPSVP